LAVLAAERASPQTPLPPAGGAGGGHVIQSSRYHIKDTFEVIHDLIVPEPDHAKSMRLQEARALCIIFRIAGVLTAIDFDDQFPLPRYEVADELSNWKLPVETDAF